MRAGRPAASPAPSATTVRRFARQVHDASVICVPIGEPGSVRVDCEVQARMAASGSATSWPAEPTPFATLYLGLEGARRWRHSEERRAWGHPKMMKGHAMRQADYYDRFERPRSAARAQLELTARAMNARLDCPPAAQVTRSRREGFMSMPLL